LCHQSDYRRKAPGNKEPGKWACQAARKRRVAATTGRGEACPTYLGAQRLFRDGKQSGQGIQTRF
jgi:hypothetical protein